MDGLLGCGAGKSGVEPMVCSLAVALMLAFSAGAGVSAAAAEPPRNAVVPAIPSGRDDFLADMLGRGETLPGSCKFSGGSVESTSLRASYSCANGEVVIELVHPDAAAAGAIRSERFAVVVQSGSVPPELEAALLERIRAREGSFEWVLPGKAAAREPWRLRIVPTAAALLALGLLVRFVRRRRAAAKG